MFIHHRVSHVLGHASFDWGRPDFRDFELITEGCDLSERRTANTILIKLRPVLALALMDHWHNPCSSPCSSFTPMSQIFRATFRKSMTWYVPDDNMILSTNTCQCDSALSAESTTAWSECLNVIWLHSTRPGTWHPKFTVTTWQVAVLQGQAPHLPPKCI